ncbi:MAG: cyclase family protein [Eubacteriales bacterium]|jgi:arylformamidase|nr:cyclase family protein [Eubacteriales bacterium]MDD3196765.1 cyclase family protein [Eubacteriales bacterium]MDD3502701.1 cyclase family protein [Eubacteriales bacterium]
MIIYDVTMTIHEGMQVYKNNPEKKPEYKVTRDFKDSPAHESRLAMDMHTGTHLDMPLHFLPDGQTVETLDLTRVVTGCRVLDLSHVEDAIHADDLVPFNIQPDETILFKTRNSAVNQFDPGFVYLAEDGAKLLVELGINCVGIDGLGIERSQANYGTHKSLLGADIVIIEGLRLQEINQGYYFLVAAPLKIAGAEAAPMRALLIERDNPNAASDENPLISL